MRINKEGNLSIGWVAGTPIVLSSAPITQGDEYILKRVHKEWLGIAPIRISIVQLHSVEKEWALLHGQNMELFRMKERVPDMIHFSTPLEYILTDKQEYLPVKAVADALKKLPKLLNAEGQIEICSWLNQKLRETHFNYDAADAYTIERYIKDFQHEVESVFLQRAKRHLAIQLETLEGKEGREGLSAEKELILIRSELLNLVNDHLAPLKEIVKLIALIEKEHPELLEIKKAGSLVIELIDPDKFTEEKWGWSQMIHQLLNQSFGALSVIYGSEKSAAIALALRAAILETPESLEMVLNWDFDSKRTNKQNVILGKKEKRVTAFREKFLEFLIQVLPRKKNEKRWPEKMKANPGLLNFFPSNFVNYDSESGEPDSLNDEGKALFLELF